MSTRSRRRRLALVLLLVTAVAALPGLQAGRASSPAAPPATFAQLRHDAMVVEDHYRAHPDQRPDFAGEFRRHGDPARLVVMVTEDPPDRPYAWEADLLYPDQLRFRVADFSLEQLLRTYRRLNRSTDEPWMRGWTGTRVALKKNRVVVYFLTGEAPSGFSRHVDMDLILIRQKGYDQPTG